MANVLTSNPKWLDTTGATSALSNIKIRLIQWIDDAEDIADSNTLVMVINGVTLTAKIQVGTTGGGSPIENVSANVGNAVVWQIGPFNPGIWCADFSLTTMSAGNLHVWVD